MNPFVIPIVLEILDEAYTIYTSLTPLKNTTTLNKMGLSQQEAYDKYQNADTDGTLIALHDTRAVHAHFVEFIEQYTPPTDGPIVTKQEFLESLLTTTFHLWWSANNNPPGFGSGNPSCLTIRRNEMTDNYDVSYYSLTNPTQTQSLDPKYYILHSNSIMVKDGNTEMIIKKTRNTTVNGNPVWEHQLRIDGNIVTIYYLVDFRLSQ